MTYRVETSETAEVEMKEIANYISDELHSLQAAYDLMYKIRQQINALNKMPMRYPLVSDERLAQMGVRSVPIKNYSIFYTVDEQERIVNIINVMYSGRDWANLL